MDPNEQGVTDGESPTVTEDVTAASSTAPQAVTAESVPALDRTPEQMFRELQRKYDQTARTQEQILQFLQAQNMQSQYQPTPPKAPTELSDEELWREAQQGNREAFELYQSRIAERVLEKKTTVQNRAGIVDRQLAALKARYPVLNDSGHALTLAVNEAFQTYLQSGYPRTKETLLQAATVAIADNPELIASIQAVPSVAREASRQNAVTRAQTGNTGVTHRREPAVPGKPPLTEEQKRLAANMQVKDPQGAKERFLQRNAEGRSTVSPNVAAALGDIKEY